MQTEEYPAEMLMVLGVVSCGKSVLNLQGYRMTYSLKPQPHDVVATDKFLSLTREKFKSASPLNREEISSLRIELGAAIHDPMLFDSLFDFYLGLPICDRNFEGSLPEDIIARIINFGMGALSREELVQLATTPLWVIELRDAVADNVSTFEIPSTLYDNNYSPYLEFARAELSRVCSSMELFRLPSHQDLVKTLCDRVFGHEPIPGAFPRFMNAVDCAVNEKLLENRQRLLDAVYVVARGIARTPKILDDIVATTYMKLREHLQNPISTSDNIIKCISHYASIANQELSLQDCDPKIQDAVNGEITFPDSKTTVEKTFYDLYADADAGVDAALASRRGQPRSFIRIQKGERVRTRVCFAAPAVRETSLASFALSSEQSIVFDAIVFGGRSIDEVHKEYDLPRSAVNARLKSAFCRIREAIRSDPDANSLYGILTRD